MAVLLVSAQMQVRFSNTVQYLIHIFPSHHTNNTAVRVNRGCYNNTCVMIPGHETLTAAGETPLVKVRYTCNHAPLSISTSIVQLQLVCPVAGVAEYASSALQGHWRLTCLHASGRSKQQTCDPESCHSWDDTCSISCQLSSRDDTCSNFDNWAFRESIAAVFSATKA